MANETKSYVTTTSGFECSVDPDALDDIEVFEDLVALQSEETSIEDKMIISIRIFKALIGADQYKRLVEHLKETEGGRAKLTSFQRELTEVFALVKSKKN